MSKADQWNSDETLENAKPQFWICHIKELCDSFVCSLTSKQTFCTYTFYIHINQTALLDLKKKTAELYFNFNGGNGIVRSTGVRSTGVNI